MNKKVIIISANTSKVFLYSKNERNDNIIPTLKISVSDPLFIDEKIIDSEDYEYKSSKLHHELNKNNTKPVYLQMRGAHKIMISEDIEFKDKAQAVYYDKDGFDGPFSFFIFNNSMESFDTDKFKMKASNDRLIDSEKTDICEWYSIRSHLCVIKYIDYIAKNNPDCEIIDLTIDGLHNFARALFIQKIIKNNLKYRVCLSDLEWFENLSTSNTDPILDEEEYHSENKESKEFNDDNDYLAYTIGGSIFIIGFGLLALGCIWDLISSD